MCQRGSIFCVVVLGHPLRRGVCTAPALRVSDARTQLLSGQKVLGRATLKSWDSHRVLGGGIGHGAFRHAATRCTVVNASGVVGGEVDRSSGRDRDGSDWGAVAGVDGVALGGVLARAVVVGPLPGSVIEDGRALLGEAERAFLGAELIALPVSGSVKVGDRPLLSGSWVGLYRLATPHGTQGWVAQGGLPNLWINEDRLQTKRQVSPPHLGQRGLRMQTSVSIWRPPTATTIRCHFLRPEKIYWGPAG